MTKCPVLLVFVLFLMSCGIDKYYYLPQVPETNITKDSNSQAELKIPSINGPEFEILYPSYSIYYRIYMSNHSTGTQQISEFDQINSVLKSDFETLSRYTSLANDSSVTDISTFRGRGYHELHFEDTPISSIITNKGGTFNIVFPTRSGEIPYIDEPGNIIDPLTEEIFKCNLFRAGDTDENNGEIFTQEPDRYFFYSTDLIEKTNHTEFINRDVNLRGSIRTDEHAYVSMYIVAVGTNPVHFGRIFGKPTHIGVYKLTDYY